MYRTVYLKTTDSCNLNCSHCFTSGNEKDRYYWQLPETRDWVQRYMDHIPATDKVHFEFHGGEPMLAPLEQLIEMRDFLRTFGPRVSIGITTNLVYKLTPEKLDFFVSLGGFASSWDADIRFDNKGQETLWHHNFLAVIEARKKQGKPTGMHVSVSRKFTEMDQEDAIQFFGSLGVDVVMFDRVTLDGNAVKNQTLFPSNQEINNWYLKMHEATKKLDARTWFRNAALEDVYAKFEQGNTACGTFCRDCEERLFTVSADGTVGGCPNSAQDQSFGHISQSLPDLMMSAKRLDVMAEERARNEKCFECPVFSYCGSDCHQLAWDGDICASPRELMKELAGIGAHRYPIRKIIPIIAK